MNKILARQLLRDNFRISISPRHNDRTTTIQIRPQLLLANCSLLERQRENLLGPRLDNPEAYISHPVNSYHLIKHWYSLTNKVVEQANVQSKNHTCILCHFGQMYVHRFSTND